MLTNDQIRGMSDEDARQHNLREQASHDAWKARQGQGYVYFLRAGNTVKIGFSTNLPKRLEQLRNGNSFPVFICRIVNGDRRTERTFHKRFAEYRTRGEWFELRGALAKFLEMHIKPVDLPNPVNDPEPERQIIL